MDSPLARDGGRVHGEQPLPARAGESARAYIANRQVPVQFTTALASIGVERLFDGLVMLVLLAAAIAAPSFPGGATIGGTALSHIAAWAAALFGAMLLVALLVVYRPAPWLRVATRAFHATLPARHAERFTRVAEGVVAGLAVLKSPERFVRVVVWSLVLWVVNAYRSPSVFERSGCRSPGKAPSCSRA